jgi:hypothetical protein
MALGLGLGLAKHSSYVLGSGFDPDYQAVLDYATSEGIALPSSEEQAKGSALVAAIKAAGDWDNIVNLMPIANSNTEFALIDWKQLRKWGSYNSPLYNAATGYTFNGTSNYIRSNELSNIASMQDFSFFISFENPSVAGYPAGEYDSGTVQFGVQIVGSPFNSRLLYQSQATQRPILAGFNEYLVNAGISDAVFYENGTIYQTIASIGTTPPARANGWAIGAINSATTISFCPTSVRFAMRGTELNDPEAFLEAVNLFF